MDLIESIAKNGVHVIDYGINEINQNYYSMCRPTLFVLRFIGGPPGLWRFKTGKHKSRIFTKVCAILMLLALNLGIVGELYFAILTSNSKLSFNQNMNRFFVIAICICGTLSLDILWWRRNDLIKLINCIDLEPKMCEVIDSACRKKCLKEIRNKTIKLFVFMLFFSLYTNFVYNISSEKFRDMLEDISTFHCHMTIFLYVLGFLSNYPFAIILSLYISLSWIFRLKVERIVKSLKLDINLANNGQYPCKSHSKATELWFISYSQQFKKFDSIFKQIAGLIYVVMVLSIMSLAEETIHNILSRMWMSANCLDFIHELISGAVLVYFLHSLSNVEHSLRKLVKLLYRLSLKIKFIDPNDEFAQNLSEKVSHSSIICEIVE